MSKKASNSQTISKIYSSRKIMLDLAKERDFDVSEYEDFTINEIQVLTTNKQLDMLLEKEDGTKMYFKYHLGGANSGFTKLRGPHILDYVEDLYEVEELLSKNDNLVIVTKDSPNPALKNLLKILEEPPQDTLIILISETNNNLPKTIISRVQIIEVNRPTREETLNWLRAINPEQSWEQIIDIFGSRPILLDDLGFEYLNNQIQEVAKDLENLLTKKIKPYYTLLYLQQF